MSEGLERAVESLAADTSRRGFLARVGRALFAASAGGTVAAMVKSGESDAFHFCGHIWTTGSCIHPTGLPRIDARGFPLRADGVRVDNLGRPVDRSGRPVDGRGRPLRDPDGRPLPPAPRARICEETGKRKGLRVSVDGSWYRCCGGKVRKLIDCCSRSSRRINGDEALTGYCFGGRKVYCVMYFDTKVPC